MVGLLDNQAVFTSNEIGEAQYMFGRFHVEAEFVVNSLRWYANGTGSSWLPDRIALCNETTNTVLRDLPCVEPAVAGWQTVDADGPVTLTPGNVYRIGTRARNVWTTWRAVLADGNIVAPPAPFVWESDPTQYYTSVSATSGFAAGTMTAAEVSGTAGSTPPEEPPASEPDPGTLDPGGSLAYWLHRATANPDSAVKLVHDWLLNDASTYLSRLSTIEGQTAVIGSVSSSGTSTAMGRLAALLTALTAVASVADDVLSAVNTILGWTEDQGAPTSLILDRLEYLQESVGLDMARRNEAITPELWTLVDTLEWDGPFTWGVPADRYRLHVETVGPFRPVNVVAGLDVLYKSGWWSLLTDTVADERRWLSFRDQDLWLPGVRAPGVLVHPWPEATGTIQAWQRNAPTP